MYNYVHTYQQNPRNSQGQLGNPGFSNKTQGLATLTNTFFGSHPTEELCFETPATTLISKNATKPTKTRCCFEAFNPRLISRVIKGKSRVHHGFVTGLEKHGVFPKPRVSGSKPRVSVAKSWVVTGKSRVNHGLRVCINSDLVFSCKK